MDSESTSAADQLPSPGVDEDDFILTPELENVLLSHLIDYQPFGINKFLNMMLIRDKIRKKYNVNITVKYIWMYLKSKWDLEAADIIETEVADCTVKSFSLPEEYNVEEEIKKMRMQDAANHETNKIKLSSGLNQTKLKSSLFPVDSKDNLNEISQASSKVNVVEPEEIPSIRRSLRVNEKPEEKELQDSNKKTNKLTRMNNKNDVKKVIDSKQPNKNIQNQFKDLEKNNIVSNIKIGKRKIRNVSESSFSSDNSKKTRGKNNLTDLNISDSSSRSVTPEMLRGKTSKQSVSPEMSRKTKLRSSDKDQKSKHSLEKASPKLSINDTNFQEGRNERLKTEKLEKSIVESKSKSSVHNKNELKQGKSKIRGRLTADLMVAQQSPVMQPLGRRSCSNNKSS